MSGGQLHLEHGGYRGSNIKGFYCFPFPMKQEKRHLTYQCQN